MTRVCISNLHTQTMITIETPRLLLRPGFPDDSFVLCDIFSEPETAWWADMPSFTDWCDVLDFIKWGNSTFDLDQYMITDKESDRLLGLIQAIGPHLSGEKGDIIEIGYFLSEKERGNGYMTEAVCALRDELFAYPCVNGLVLKILPNNEASKGVALRSGFHFVEQAQEDRALRHLDNRPLDRYLLTREDYESLRLAA